MKHIIGQFLPAGGAVSENGVELVWTTGVHCSLQWERKAPGHHPHWQVGWGSQALLGNYEWENFLEDSHFPLKIIRLD